MKFFESLSPAHKGIVFMAGGIVMLLYTLGILTQGLHMVFILGSLTLIVYGAHKSGLSEKVLKMIKR